ncbi:sialate O-acetylesterase [Flavobacterium silvaticum]|uniref:Sialate O-acetylesterase n=1 Tax=Flavobacterium silvaticum TaxID=1852020 RepID=A0A972FK24_9FLAO|nr:sialate O-acetylesterase [Flavobacterium silvaticum]NMH27421.1 sialate O-acetylesterase [Flavobacterium silvaticum]
MNKILLLIVMLISGFTADANIVLPAVISDNMVLQRNATAAIWGWAQPNEEITITTGWDNAVYKVKSNAEANWSTQIKTPNAGGPFAITLKGYNEITLKNILIGEVWLCSGQSNMEMSADWKIDNGDHEIANATNPNLRLFSVPKRSALYPQQDLQAQWTLCTPETMRYFSAVGYFFGQRISAGLNNIPIGLIQSAWGGTPAEIWMPEDAVSSNPIVREAASKLSPIDWGPTLPGRAYNAMIHPLVPFTIAGALWYQGESNTGSDVYDQTLTTLIQSWRNAWKSDFPFYIVQIAPYNYENNPHGGAVIRDAQRKVAQTVPNTGVVVIGDVSPLDDIHPKDKKTVGLRLANLALAKHYKVTDAVVNGPLIKKATWEKGSVTLSFDNANGLYFTNKKSQLFELAGQDGKFYVATVTLSGNTIKVHSKDVKTPLWARYAFKSNDVPDLFNSDKLPASTFLVSVEP